MAMTWEQKCQLLFEESDGVKFDARVKRLKRAGSRAQLIDLLSSYVVQGQLLHWRAAGWPFVSNRQIGRQHSSCLKSRNWRQKGFMKYGYKYISYQSGSCFPAGFLVPGLQP